MIEASKIYQSPEESMVDGVTALTLPELTPLAEQSDEGTSRRFFQRVFNSVAEAFNSLGEAQHSAQAFDRFS